MGYSKNFWLLAFSVLLFMMSFNLLIPELNTIMEQLQAGDKKGLVFIFFSLAAAVSRPIAGKLSDTIGRKKVMYFGIFLGAIVCAIYPTIHTLSFFLFIRFLHGFSASFHPTAATAMVTDILPKDKRGKGMGIWGVFIALGFGIGQVISTPIIHHFNYSTLFYTAVGFALLAALLLSTVRETLPKEQKQTFSLKLFRLKKDDIVEPSIRPAAIVMFLSAACSGFVFVITPDMTGFLSIENKGFFFGIYTLSTLFIRLIASSLSDKIGRRNTLIVAMTLLGSAMLLIGYSSSFYSFLIAALFYGIASGISSPTLMAWMADLSHPQRRGVASGTLYMALEFGFMFGAGISIISYTNSLQSAKYSFSIAAVLCFIAIAYLCWHILTQKKAAQEQPFQRLSAIFLKTKR